MADSVAPRIPEATHVRNGARSQSVRVPKTAEVVAASIRSRIVRGELATGDSLPREPELIEMFSISRPTLREAFRILESERLIEVRRGSRGGARVMSPEIDNAAAQVGLIMQFRGVTVDSVYQTRALLEAPAISVMSEPPGPELLKRLAENLEVARAIVAGQGPQSRELHVVSREFHTLLVDAGGNGALTIFNDMICDIVDRGGAQYEKTRSERDFSKAQRAALNSHAKIYELLASGDMKAADELWRAHTAAVAENLARANPAGSTVLDLLS
jgi:GntR family transcriptional repressor for pyruvate dehydrogenase complex